MRGGFVGGREAWIGIAAGILIAGFLGSRPSGALVHLGAVLALRISLLLAAMSLHEWAHAWTADRFGDPTARRLGRLTLDPRSHFDLVGLVLVPGALALAGAPVSVGWAKPVPVDFARLRKPRLHGALVAAAGPASNFAAALVMAFGLRLLGVDGTEGVVASSAWALVAVNVALGAFNLLPFFPMDGGRILASLLPARVGDVLQRNQGRAALATLALLVALPWALSAFGVQASPLAPVVAAVERLMDLATGVPGERWAAPLEAWVDGPQTR